MTKNRTAFKIIIASFMILLIISVANITLAAEFSTMKYSDKYIEWLNFPEDERKDTIAPLMYVKNATNNIQCFSLNRNLKSAEIKERYSLLEDISLKVKDQMETGQCWAFSTTTQLESYMALVKSKNVEYSPRHIEYSTAKTFLDGTNPLGYNREVNSGGNPVEALGYLTSGQGPILEKDMPFVNTTNKINLSEIKGKTVQAQLEEYKIFPSIYKEKNNGIITYSNGQTGEDRIEYSLTEVNNIRNKIKQHIMTYGAVTGATSTSSTQFFSNQESIISSKAYNCDDSTVQADHQVTIIGWDDNYAASNFNENPEKNITEDHTPTSPGAWIIQNSYGTEREDQQGNVQKVFNDGLIYISYEDFLIETIMTGVISLEEVDYDNVYQYDNLGVDNALTTNLSEIYTANVFKKDNEVSYLNEVGIFTLPGHSYEIYVNSKNGQLDSNLVKVKTVEPSESDYITVDLDNPIKLEGDSFVVAIRYIADEIAYAPVECVLTLEFLHSFDTAKSNAGESYVSVDGTNWQDCKDLSIIGMDNINACIKAFTVNDIADEPIVVTLKSNSYTIGSEAKIITKVLPNTTVNSFKKNLITNGTVKLYDKDENEITGTQIVKTGSTLKIDETSDTYKISVIGDINGDGKITLTDLSKLKKHLIFIDRLEGIFINSADINKDGVSTSTDLFKMKQLICKIITL